MKRILLSMFTLFAVLFTSVVTANAEETTTIRIGEVKAKKATNYYSTAEMANVVGSLKPGDYKVYKLDNGAYGTYSNGLIWLSPKDVTYTPYPNPTNDVPGYITVKKEVPTYASSSVPKGEFREGIWFNAYSYDKGMFLGNLPDQQGSAWVSEKDVDFTQATKDKETPVSAETIGSIASLEGEQPIYSQPNNTSATVGTLKQDAFKTTLEVKGKVNGFYNVGENKWVEGNTDKVRFFPVGAETNLYKLVYDAREFEGIPYKDKGIQNTGFDNTGFVYRVFKDSGYTVGKFTLDGFEKLAAKTTKPHIGDLIFLKADKDGKRNIGIIVSESGKYIYVNEKEGVIVEKFNTTDTNISGFGRLR